MIKPVNGEKALLQWTRGAVIIADVRCDVIRVSREDDQKAVEIAPNKVGAISRIEIPDRMLTESGYLKISCIDRAQDGERIVDTARILIRPQQKPDGYVYGSQESGSWQALRLRMDALERAAREGKFDGKPGKDYVLTDEDKQEIADLVEASGGGNPGTAYETVNSVDEMTDTSKMYILSSTGTLWAYGQRGEPQPNFTNLADPSSADWWNDSFFNSGGGQNHKEGYAVSNFIGPLNAGDVIYIEGLRLSGKTNEYRCAPYRSNKTIHGTFGVTTLTAFSTLPTPPIADLTFTETGARFVNNHAEIKYWRIGGLLNRTSDDVVITINEEITYTEGYVWYDTGYAPSGDASGNGGENYAELLVKVNNNTADIAYHSKRLTALESGSDMLTIPNFWQSAVDTCIAKIKALQVGRNCVTFPFFSDNHTRDGAEQYMGMLIAHIMRECGIPYCFYGGDAITNAMASTADSDAEFREQAAAFARAMSYIPDGRFCMALGNHETWLVANPNIEGSTRVDYNRDQTYEIFLRDEGTAQNKHFGGDGTYYYVDDIASRVRFIILNTNGIGNSNLDAEQLAWLRDTALTFSKSGWAAVIISHVPITNHYEQSNIPNAAEVVATVNASGVEIIGWFSGHIHRDRIYTGMSVNDTDDTVGDPLGFTQVTITSDHTVIAYPLGQSPTTHPIDDSDKSHAIDFVTVNRDTRTVNITRLGIGEDRSYTYTAAENPYEPVGDYVLTEADKSEIAEIAISKLPVYNGEVDEV